MQVHKLTSTRVITSITKNYEQELFTGSSYNRKAKETVKIDTANAWEEASRQIIYSARPGEVWEDIVAQYGVGGLEVSPGGNLQPTVPRKPRINTLSNRSKDKVRNKIESLFRCSNGFTLATLTFINQVEDRQGVKVLNKFLTVVRKRNPGLQYIWIAERQENGNIHFHIITNKFLKVSVYNALWVIQQYNDGIECPGITEPEMRSFLVAGELQKHLNPFDIKQVKTVEGLAIYLTMYVTKNNSGFDCATWYCSRAISALFTGVLVGEEVAQEAENKDINWSVNKKTGEYYEAKAYVMEYATIVSIFNKKYFKKYFKVMDIINAKILAGLGKCPIPTVDFFSYDLEYNKPVLRDKKIIITQINNLKFSAN